MPKEYHNNWHHWYAFDALKGRDAQAQVCFTFKHLPKRLERVYYKHPLVTSSFQLKTNG